MAIGLTLKNILILSIEHFALHCNKLKFICDIVGTWPCLIAVEQCKKTSFYVYIVKKKLFLFSVFFAVSSLICNGRTDQITQGIFITVTL